MSTISRNAPCPCGSGKKYKRCCGDQADIAVLPAFGKAESDRAIALLMKMVESKMFAGVRAAAQAEFFGDAFESAREEQVRAALENEQTLIAFNAWLIFDAYITKDRHRLMESVLSGDLRGQFTTGQLRFLERMAASHMRPYEVREVRQDEGFSLRDLWSDVDVTVSERSATHYLSRGATFFARVIEGPRGAPEMHGAVLVLMPLAMQELLVSLRASFRAKRRKRLDLDEATFFKEAGPQIGRAWVARFTFRMPAMQTTDGEALRSQDMIYDIVDREALARALDASDEFNWNESGEQYVWLRGSSKVPGMANTVLGSLTPEGSRLRVHVISDERAKRLRSLLDRIAPAALRYRLSEIHDFSKIGQSAPSATRISDIPPEVESQILAEFSGRYYRAWLDEQIPALGGRTPRHAATLKTQRSKVAALLREIEMRSPKAHVPDTAWMWEELGLTDLR